MVENKPVVNGLGIVRRSGLIKEWHLAAGWAALKKRCLYSGRKWLENRRVGMLLEYRTTIHKTIREGGPVKVIITTFAVNWQGWKNSLLAGRYSSQCCGFQFDECNFNGGTVCNSDGDHIALSWTGKSGLARFSTGNWSSYHPHRFHSNVRCRTLCRSWLHPNSIIPEIAMVSSACWLMISGLVEHTLVIDLALLAGNHPDPHRVDQVM